METKICFKLFSLLREYLWSRRHPRKHFSVVSTMSGDEDDAILAALPNLGKLLSQKIGGGGGLIKNNV